MPMAMNGTHVVSRENGSKQRIALRDIGSGKLIWQVTDTFARPGAAPPPGEGGDDARHRIEARFAAGQVVLRDGSQVQVRALSTARLLWHTTSPTSVSAVELAGELVLIAADSLVARRIGTGEHVWELPLRGVRLAVSAAGDSILAAHDKGLSNVDLQGRSAWQEPYPAGVRDSMPERLSVDERAAYVTFRPPRGKPGPPPSPRTHAGPPDGPQGGIDVVAYRIRP